MKKLSCVIVLFTVLTSCVYAQQGNGFTNTDSLELEQAKAKQANMQLAAKTQLVYFVIKNGNAFGYDLYADGNLYIHQASIPGVVGTQGFSDTTKAGITARFAIQKIKEGNLPPTITPDELKALGVIPKD